MSTTPYDALRSATKDRGFDKLPGWGELKPEVRQTALRVLRRLGVARALESDEPISRIEAETGLGEDAALRTYLLCTCFRMLHDSTASESKRPPWAALLSALLESAHIDRILEECWVYRDQPLEPWSGLHAVGAGFDLSETEELQRLRAARKSWDEASREDKLDTLATALEKLASQYPAGNETIPAKQKKIWGSREALKELRQAAINDSFSLLSDGAYDALTNDDAPAEQFDGVDVLVRDGEGYVRRSAFAERAFQDWQIALSAFDPEGGEGDAAHMPNEGMALVVTGGAMPVVLRRWVEDALAGMIARA